MRPVTVTVGPLTGSSTNNIALSQTPTGPPYAVTLNGSLASGGVATLSNAQRIGIASAGNDSGITFAISGTDAAGNPQSETVTGGNVATVSSLLDYLTVTSIVASGATAAAITVGTTGIGASPWVRFDEWALGPVECAFVAIGTANYTLQTTSDDPNSLFTSIARSAVVWDVSGSPVIAATTNLTVSLATAPIFARVLLNSGSGSVRATFTQYGVAPR